LPTFDDELPYDANIAKLCNYVSACISDAIISGIPDVGVKTKTGIQEKQTKAAETSKFFFFFFFKLILILLN
jgi:hypothetical protein